MFSWFLIYFIIFNAYIYKINNQHFASHIFNLQPNKYINKFYAKLRIFLQPTKLFFHHFSTLHFPTAPARGARAPHAPFAHRNFLPTQSPSFCPRNPSKHRFHAL